MNTRVHHSRMKPAPSGAILVGPKNRHGSTGYFAPKHPRKKLCGFCRQRFGLIVRHNDEEFSRLWRLEFFERVQADADYRLALVKLRGRVLVCCGVKACHAHLIVSFVDSLPLPASEEEVIAAARNELAKLAAQAGEEADAV